MDSFNRDSFISPIIENNARIKKRETIIGPVKVLSKNSAKGKLSSNHNYEW